MTYKVLSDLVSRIKDQPDQTVINLNVATIGELLAFWLEDLLTAPVSVKITSPLAPVDDPSTTMLKCSGTANIGATLSEIQVDVTFFASWLADAPTDQSLEVLIVATNPPPSITFDKLGLPQPTTVAAVPTVFETQRDAFFQKVTLSSATTLLVSSYDFAFAATEDNAKALDALSCSLAAVPADPPPMQGLNVGATVQMGGELWDMIAAADTGKGLWGQLQSLATTGLHFYGAIDLDEWTGERLATITHQMGADGPVLTLPFGSLKAAVQSVSVSGGLDSSGGLSPTLILQIAVPAGQPDPRVFNLDIPIGAGEARIWARFDAENALDLSMLTSLAGVNDLSSFGEPLSKLKVPKIVALDFSATLPGFDQAQGTVTLSAGTLDLIPGKISVSPEITLGVSHASGTAATPIAQLTADWRLGGNTDGTGGTNFDVFIDVETQDLALVMKPGETLSLTGSPFAKPAINPKTDALELVDLEIRGNLANKTFAFQVEVASTLSVDLGTDSDGNPVALALTDLQMAGDWSETEVDWRVEGIFAIGTTHADIIVEDDADGLSFSANLDRIAVGDIVQDILSGVHLPDTLHDFAIDDVTVSYGPGGFTLEGGPSTMVSPFGGFDFVVSRFKVTRPPAGDTTGAKPDLHLHLNLHLGGVALELTGASDGDDWTFTAAELDESIPLGALVDSMLAMVDLTFPLPIEELAVGNIGCRYSTGKSGGAWLFGATLQDAKDKTKVFGQLTFAAAHDAATDALPNPVWDYLIAAELDIDLDFSRLPVAGSELPGLKVQSADLVVASKDLTADRIGVLLNNAPQGILLPPQVAYDAGANLSIKVDGPPGIPPIGVKLDGVVGNTPVASPGQVPDTPATPPPPTPLPANDHTKWVDVAKSFGSISVARVGLRYKDGQMALLFDASMTLGPVTVGFMGLGLESPINHPDLTPTLDGLSVDYSGAGMSVGGGLIHTADGYSGQLHLSAEAFSLVVLGRYSVDPKGLFLFGITRDPPLGGPPEFYVEGVAAGMGYNAGLVLPTSASDVANFSMVQAAMPSALPPFDGNSDMSDILRRIDIDCPPSSGETWLAAGVHFSSFGSLIDSFALLAVEFSGSPKIAILGLSRATLPPDAPDPVALFEVGLIATFDPGVGAFKLDGALTNRSYVLSRDAHLTGGFGFYAWMKDGEGASAGDFVYTMGGYHPQFQVPAHYPHPPRLSLAWQVSDDLSIKGSSYFALTPHCLMAGLSIEANWSSGDISAWFDADADFLVYWKPFHYIAHIDTSIGASFTIDLLFTSVTVTVHVGVGLDLEGPPFGGSAHIDLDVISFTIRFGDRTDETQFLKWSEFQTNFLPAEIITPRTLAGLVHDFGPGVAKGQPQWVLSADTAAIAVALTVPAKTVALGTEASEHLRDPGWNMNVDFAVAAMGIAKGAMSSDLQVILTYRGIGGKPDDPEHWPVCDMRFDAVQRATPASLWGEAGSLRPDDPNAPTLVLDTLVGIEIHGLDPVPDTTDPVDLKNLRYDEDSPDLILVFAPTLTIAPYAVPPAMGDTLTYAVPGASGTCTNLTLQTIAAAADARADMIARMRSYGMLTPDFDSKDAVDLSRFATTTVLDAWPLVRALGEV